MEEIATFPHPLGKFTLVSEIARGGMGIVYRAEQAEPKRIVALKVLREKDPVLVQRFAQEVAAAARLVHPGILPVFEVGEAGGEHFFTMEYIEGKPFDQWLAQDAPPLTQRIEVIRDIARAVNYAHEQKIIHRDLKPANILVDQARHAWITDFGIAREMGVPSSLTGANIVVGTPAYMSPEQALGDPEKLSPRSDVYGLGAVLYEAATGRAPFSGRSDIEVLDKVLHEDLVPPRSIVADLPSDLERVILKALEKEPEGRYASADDFAEDLQRFLRGDPVMADPGGPLYRKWRKLIKNKALTTALVVAAVAFIGLEVWYLTRSERLQDQADALEQRQARQAEARDAYERGLLAKGRAAVDLFSKAIAADDGLVEAWFERGRARLRAGEAAKAAEDFSKALLLKPGMPAVHFWRGVAYQDYLGRPEDARRDYEQVAKLAPEQDLGLLAQGSLLEAEGKPGEAEELFTRAIERVPGSPMGYQRRAHVRITRGRTGEAIADAKKALELDPDAAPVLHNLAVALTQEGKLDEAIEALGKAIAVDPRNPVHYHSRGVALAQKKDHKAAVQDYARAISLNPRMALTFHCLARSHYELGEMADAQQDCNIAIMLAPEFADPYAARGLISFQRELYPNAIRDWEAFLRLAAADHPGRAMVQQQLALARKRTSAQQDRRVLVEEWIEQAEDAFLARKYDRAEECYDRALDLDPALGMAHYGLACVNAQRYEPYREFRNFDMWDREKRRRLLDSALEHLAACVKAKFGQIDELAEDPDLAPIREDPRFLRILRGEAYEPSR